MSYLLFVSIFAAHWILVAAHKMLFATTESSRHFSLCILFTVTPSIVTLFLWNLKVRDLQDEVKSSGITKTQKELQRLREELFKSRRSETQKERENVFLQKQLLMAAEVFSSSAGKGKVDT